MARSGLHQHWWWFLMTILVCLLRGHSAVPQRPTRIGIPMASRDKTTNTAGEIVIFLRDKCNSRRSTPANGNDINQLRQFVDKFEENGGTSVSVLDKSLTCDTKSWGLGVLVDVLERPSTRALIAALDINTCEAAERLAYLWNKPLLTWTCPAHIGDNQPTSTIRLSPSLPVVAQALAEIFLHFKWRSASLIAMDEEPWSSLARAVIGVLRSIGIIPRHHALISRQTSASQIHQSLASFETIIPRAIVLCLPLEDEKLISRVMREFEALRTSRTDNSVFLLVHPEGPEFFLPTIGTLSDNSTSTTATSTTSAGAAGGKRRGRRFHGRMKNLLAFAPFDMRYNLGAIYNGTQLYKEPRTVDRLNESLSILMHDNSSLNTNNNKMFIYGLLGWSSSGNTDGIWYPIAEVIESREYLVVRELAENDLVDEETLDPVLCSNENDCRGDNRGNGDDPLAMRTSHIIVIIMVCLLLTFVVFIITILLRRHLVNKRVSKGPFKIILTASDFVFPQPTDNRRVDEGIETMLCCWLKQLQEFGGPEVEKPDLLQGSVGSLKPHLKASTGSLAWHTILKDPRARYNGDLVQLKELPCQANNFELKGKAMDVLIMIHGLRHENLNPFIGCLTEPARPCLVTEYCTRGSLEDVLMQDEIKLDWSFRLSLLTDLVRGMKYLHNSPIRVHGFLTSRNCVIDARWVLKVADYGLPAFYEAQSIVTPTKNARDLLWTAPELLRHSGLRKRGTQPGDVYSFGIIMQEVVVRGEPFCMLALSPEDIIAKVKKPPPLIRPSVSKGAAPPEAINIMRQCWAEAADMRPDYNAVHDLFKKLNHGRKVNFVDTMFQMLEKYSNNLEELIRERTEQLDMEKKKTEQLLNRMLPSTVAEKLKLGMPVDPEEFAEVTIYFSDIVGFTAISAHSTPFQVVDLLNDLYTCFDDTINAYNVYKVETIGDAYMVVGGCPVRIQDHASQIATMALDLLHQSGKFKVRHLARTQLRLRIGLHTGPCCAGVVGLTMPRYCLFGDTVNTASRMESTGAPWRIHLSQATRDRLCQVGGYHIEYRGCTDVKGKGKMPTYWLLGKQGFDKPLPTPPPLGLEESLGLKLEGDISPASEEPSRASPIDTPTILREPTIDEVIIPSIKDDDDNSSGQSSSSFTTTCTSSKFSAAPSFQERVTTRKVAVSVHDEKDINFPATASDVAAALLGAASTTSLSSISSSAFRGSSSRHRRVGHIDEDDLSTPYNYYRCLSPNEHYSKGTSRLLKRQFSLDRADEPVSIISECSMSSTAISRPLPRLYKQNSAGAANDLEKIEEVPSSTPATHQTYRHAASMSLSVESLTLR
ncbi:retinal guanylyl cyclase 2 isoform X2 [Diachasmimorpha longicaudata]|uniref:retinal guanylyl cyclase 2 isoform X2 n=1 Tax=Diachasmimorpha longicaudata TaxID=58733 RepID=UPI0030B873B1